MPLKYLKDKVSAVPRRGETDAAELLRANLRARIPQKTQGEVARKAGIPSPDQTLSNFFAKHQKQLNYRYLGPLAKELGCSIADLFGPVPENDGVNSHVIAPASDSPHGNSEIGVLNVQLAEQNQELRALRIAVNVAADELRDQAGKLRVLTRAPRGNVRAAAQRKPKAR